MKWLKKSGPPDLPPEAMVVGLGNPGPEYNGTRHNVGFEVVDELARRFRVPVRSAKFRAVYGTGTVADRSVVLVKPVTFMNLSGQAVAALARHFSIPPESIMVVADDLDLAVARVRMKPKGSHGGHNGHRSVIQSLGTDTYPRIKLGIGKAGDDPTVAHVLSKFPPDERVEMDRAVERASDGVEVWLREGLERAMNLVNGP